LSGEAIVFIGGTVDLSSGAEAWSSRAGVWNVGMVVVICGAAVWSGGAEDWRSGTVVQIGDVAVSGCGSGAFGDFLVGLFTDFFSSFLTSVSGVSRSAPVVVVGSSVAVCIAL